MTAERRRKCREKERHERSIRPEETAGYGVDDETQEKEEGNGRRTRRAEELLAVVFRVEKIPTDRERIAFGERGRVEVRKRGVHEENRQRGKGVRERRMVRDEAQVAGPEVDDAGREVGHLVHGRAVSADARDLKTRREKEDGRNEDAVKAFRDERPGARLRHVERRRARRRRASSRRELRAAPRSPRAAPAGRRP